MAEITMVINGERFSIGNDPQKFTAEELIAVEQHTGMMVTEWAEKLADERISPKAWTALAFIAVRRAGRMVRWDDFAATLSVYDLVQGLGGIPDPPAVVPNRAERRAKPQPKTAPVHPASA
jgi:hypothetical protein